MRYKFGFTGFLLSITIAVSALQGIGVRVVSPAAAQALIAQVLVEGNQRIEADTVRSYMVIGVGDPFDPIRIDHFRTSLFADRPVRGCPDISGAQQPRRRRSRKTRSSTGSVSRATANSTTTRWSRRSSCVARMVFTRARVQADVQRHRSPSTGARVSFAGEVEPKIIRLPQNRVDLVFEINEGESPRSSASTSSATGRSATAQLRGVISTAESGWWKFLTSRTITIPIASPIDKELLRRYYLKNGYADFRVSRPRPSWRVTARASSSPSRSRKVPQYSLGQVRVTRSARRRSTPTAWGPSSRSQGDAYDATKSTRPWRT